MRFVAVLVTLLVSLSLASAASAQITFVNYSGQAGDPRVIFSRIGVTRGAQNYAYWDTEVIMPSLTAFPANGLSNLRVLTPFGATKDAHAFLRDPYLNTGVTGFGTGDGTSFGASDQWIQLTFDKPIVNSTGPDGFIATLGFEWISQATYQPIISTSPGNSYVFPSSGAFFGSNTDPLPYYSYLSTLTTPSQLLTFNNQNTGSLIDPSWALQTFDLSSMGVPLGNSVSTLYLQDWSGNGNSVDVMFLAGFPAVPEPATVGLLTIGLLAIGWRRR